MAKEKSAVDWIARILVIIGAINLGLFSFWDNNLVAVLFETGTVAKVVYALIGLSGLWELIRLFKN